MYIPQFIHDLFVSVLDQQRRLDKKVLRTSTSSCLRNDPRNIGLYCRMHDRIHSGQHILIAKDPRRHSGLIDPAVFPQDFLSQQRYKFLVADLPGFF